MKSFPADDDTRYSTSSVQYRYLCTRFSVSLKRNGHAFADSNSYRVRSLDRRCGFVCPRAQGVLQRAIRRLSGSSSVKPISFPSDEQRSGSTTPKIFEAKHAPVSATVLSARLSAISAAQEVRFAALPNSARPLPVSSTHIPPLLPPPAPPLLLLSSSSSSPS